MSTVAEIEAIVPSLTAEELVELEQFIRRARDSKVRGSTLTPRQLPLVGATGRAITQEEINDALDAD
jgi:hypothetical protein